MSTFLLKHERRPSAPGPGKRRVAVRAAKGTRRGSCRRDQDNFPAAPQRANEPLPDPEGAGPHRRRSRPCARILPGTFWLAALLAATPAVAQQPWEYAPYRIRLWVAMAPAGELNEVTQRDLIDSVARRVDVVVGAPWDLTATPPPAALSADIAFQPEQITAEGVALADEKALHDDKIWLLSVAANPREYRIRARELDCRTRMWGPLVERAIRNPQQLQDAALDALLDAFVPVTRIEGGEAKTAVVRLRAGGLLVGRESPAYVGDGDILLPIVRSNDRYGKPIPGKIEEIAWTLLQVTGRNHNNASILDCNVYSGTRAPIRSRVSARKERYALGVRATQAATQLLVQGRVRRRDEVPAGLADLEIYSKDPVAEPPTTKSDEEKKDEEKRNPPELLGITDWRGAIEVRPGAAACRILYIKNGGQLLARLPIVPGRQAQQIAQVPDDSPRLQAEGYIKGLSGEIMDLVAQRQILAARIRKRIREGKLDDVEALLDEFRSLKTRNDLQRSLDQQQRVQLASPYITVQARIDKLYGDTRTMLGKYLDPNLGNALREELQQARRQPGPSPKPPAANSQARRPSPPTGESPAPR